MGLWLEPGPVADLPFGRAPREAGRATIARDVSTVSGGIENARKLLDAFDLDDEP